MLHVSYYVVIFSLSIVHACFATFATFDLLSFEISGFFGASCLLHVFLYLHISLGLLVQTACYMCINASYISFVIALHLCWFICFMHVSLVDACRSFWAFINNWFNHGF